jgi:hypothetical protein
MGGLVKFRRTDGQTPDARSLVTLRPKSIAFNAHFIRMNDLHEKTRVTVLCDADRFQVGFQFHSNASDQDSFALTTDGGRKGKTAYGRAIEVQALMKRYRWLKAAATPRGRLIRRYSPEWRPTYGAWIINVRPSFEIRVSIAEDIDPGLHGIYRYLSNDKIVYVGRGDIRSRANSPDREAWLFDTIEYSVIEDLAEQEKWETWWLDDYRNEFGALPFYNRVGGKHS